MREGTVLMKVGNEIDPWNLIKNKPWNIGAYTPARCELWRQLGAGDIRKRLDDWIKAEWCPTQKNREPRCHKTELPPRNKIF